ncbi:acyl-CoA thioesterase [Stigmatella hybrida]|uniref:acyl-CoA thioesterase n=1 Tax=Stigmatella hybrida TaxID=394097 RepID=UPI001CDA9C6F|nr:thioesterase family protein [Stigmatella hybrida]
MVEARLRVIYGDTDQMGVVYHANYFRYFEFARSEYFRARGGSYRELEKEGFLLPVVDLSCQYKVPARYDDVLLVRAKVSELRRASLTFSYEMFREEDLATLLSTGHTTHACVGRDGKPRRMPEFLTRLIEVVP